jgi:hypothetical protein
MKTQFTHLDNSTNAKVQANAVKKSGRDHLESPQHPILIVSRLFFAVFVVGFIGYYFDRLLQAWLFKTFRAGRAQS